jgi:hypothetical protein
MSTTKDRSVAGATLSIGAGLGATVGLLIAGAPGIGVGVCLGAAVGILVGAAWDAFHSAP